MNDNLPESERWVPAPAKEVRTEHTPSPALDRARREAEAVIAAEQVRAGHAVDWSRYSGGYYAR